MKLTDAVTVGIILLAVHFNPGGALAAQAWGASAGGTNRIHLVPINTADGAFDLANASSSGDSLPFIGIDDLASDPLRFPSFVWAVRSGSVNDMFVVDPYREQIISQFLLDTPFPILGIAINPVSGVLYGTASDALYTIEPFTGQTTRVASMPTPVTDGIGFDSLGRLFGINSGVFYEINATDGSATPISSLSANFAVDLAVDPDSGVMYALGPNVYDLVTIDVDSGVVSSLGSSYGRAGGLAFTVAPEPSAAALIAIAWGGACAGRRSRAQSSVADDK